MVNFTSANDFVDCIFYVDGWSSESKADRMHTDGKIFLPINYTVYCPLCGEGWARRVIKGFTMRFWAKDKPCIKCGYGFLWDPYDDNWNRSLSPKLLTREVDILSMFYDAGFKQYTQLFPAKPYKRGVYSNEEN